MSRRNPLFFLGTLMASFFFLVPRAVQATAQPDVRILDQDGNVITVFVPFTDPDALIGSVTTHDLGHDGVAEILVGAGEDSDPNIFVFRQDGSLIGSFQAYETSYRGGVNVAACDVNGDGSAEIITAPIWNGGPHVRIFNSMGKELTPGFFAFDSSFTGGINLACGDLDGDHVDEIVVGASAGGGPHVKVFDDAGKLRAETFIDNATKNTGASIAVDDVNNDGLDEILTSTMGYSVPNVTTWSLNATTQILEARSVVTSSQDQSQLITPIGIDEEGNVMIASMGYVQPFIGTLHNEKYFLPFSFDATHGISASIMPHNKGQYRYVVANITPRMNDDVSAKSIRVDISQQRLTAYEYAVPTHTFLVSTAKQGYVTPRGKTDVKEKLLYHTYKWIFGIGDPRNYNVPNMKWNLRIYDHIYIHWAYWHNNFGNPMSHGCINANAENSEWIYLWSDVGTTVNVVE